MSKLSIMIRFNRDVTDKDLACIGLEGIYLKTNKSRIGLDYMEVEKTREGKPLILFRLKNDDLDTFPEMEKLQDVLQEDGLMVDELNIEYDPMDIPPIYPTQIYSFLFTLENCDPTVLPNGVVLDYPKSRMILNSNHFDNVYHKWNIEIAEALGKGEIK